MTDTWRISLDVEAPQSEIVKLQQLLPSMLTDAGFTVIGGTRTELKWYAEDVTDARDERQLSGEWGPAISDKRNR